MLGMATKPLGGLIFVLLTLVLPVTAYKVAVLVTWFEVQKGLVALCEIPHGFIRLGSVIVASPTTLALVINKKSAKALGLPNPSSLLLRADRVVSQLVARGPQPRASCHVSALGA